MMACQYKMTSVDNVSVFDTRILRCKLLANQSEESAAMQAGLSAFSRLFCTSNTRTDYFLPTAVTIC